MNLLHKKGDIVGLCEGGEGPPPFVSNPCLYPHPSTSQPWQRLQTNKKELPLAVTSTSQLLVRNVCGTVWPSYRRHAPSAATKAPEELRAAVSYFTTKYKPAFLTLSCKKG